MKRIINLTLVALIVSFMFVPEADAGTVYARDDGDWDDTNIWSTSGVGGSTCSCTPGSGDSVVIDGYQIDINDADVTIASMLLTNDQDRDKGQLQVENGIKLTITGNLWVIAEDVGEDTKFKIRDNNSEVEVQGNVTFKRTNDNDVKDKLYLKMEDNTLMTVNGSFTFYYGNSNSNENAEEIVLVDDATLHVDGNVKLQLENGKNFKLDMEDDSKFTAGSNFTIVQNGGEDIAIDIDDNAILADTGNFLIDQNGGDDIEIKLNAFSGNGATIYASDFQWEHDGGDNGQTWIYNSSSLFHITGDVNINWNSGNDDKYICIIYDGNFTVDGDLYASRYSTTHYIYFKLDGGQLTTNDMNLTNYGTDDPDHSIYIYVDNAANITVYGNLTSTLNNGRDIQIKLGAYTSGSTAGLDVTGNITFDHNSATGGEDMYILAEDNTTVSVGGTLFLDHDGSGSDKLYIQLENNAALTVAGNIQMDGVADGQIEIKLKDDSYLYIAGNFVRQAVPNNYGKLDGKDNSTVVYNGSSAQVFAEDAGAGSDKFKYENVTINNTYGTSPQLTLEGDATINGTLTMTDGILKVGSNDLILSTSGTTAGGSNDSYVDVTSSNGGKKIKLFNTNSSIDFLVGDDNEYTPFTFTKNSSVGGTANISVDITDAQHPNLGPGDLITRYWTIDASGISSLDYDVSYKYQEADVSGTEVNMFAARWNGSVWTQYNNVNEVTNTLSSSSGITEIPSGGHDFSAGSGSALPIELLRMSVKAKNSSAEVKWTTVTEINNSFFTLERSQDGIHYNEIAIIEGAGTSYQSNDYVYIDKMPLIGTSYYRLMQTDLNGEYEYFQPVSFHINKIREVTNMKVFPNPLSAGQQLTIKMNEPIANEEVLVVLYNMNGQEVYSKVNITENNGILTGIDLFNKLPQGVYLITASSKEEICQQKLIITGRSNGVNYETNK